MECIRKIQLKSGEIVPCGKCYACLANNRQEWIFRLQQEYKASNLAIFVTLTYDDLHIPKDLSVNKRDVQLFHKRLRKHFPAKDLRFYLVSEYGDHTHRPHYHGLYFFKTLYDLDFIYKTFTESWKNGFLKFGNVEEGSIVYCTKYCLKHSAVPPGRLKTFRLVSKMNGGLGVNYLDKMSYYHLSNEQYSYVAESGKSCRMPRYYRLQLGHVRDRFSESDELYTKISDDFRKRYSDFIRLHGKFSSVEAGEAAFLESERQRRERSEDLVLKHLKKQRF